MRTKLTVLGNQGDWAKLYPIPLSAPKLQELQKGKAPPTVTGRHREDPFGSLRFPPKALPTQYTRATQSHI